MSSQSYWIYVNLYADCLKTENKTKLNALLFTKEICNARIKVVIKPGHKYSQSLTLRSDQIQIQGIVYVSNMVCKYFLVCMEEERQFPDFRVSCSQFHQ